MLAQLIVSGVAVGCVYALIALGMTILFRSTTIVNFCHGEFFMLGAFAVLLIVGRGDRSLEGRLGMYGESTPAPPAGDGSLVETGLVQRAVDLTVGTLAAQVQTQAGSIGVAASPRPVPPARGPFSSAGGRYLVLLLAAVAAGLGAFQIRLHDAAAGA